MQPVELFNAALPNLTSSFSIDVKANVFYASNGIFFGCCHLVMVKSVKKHRNIGELWKNIGKRMQSVKVFNLAPLNLKK